MDSLIFCLAKEREKRNRLVDYRTGHVSAVRLCVSGLTCEDFMLVLVSRKSRRKSLHELTISLSHTDRIERIR
jgi:hypothetical protein